MLGSIIGDVVGSRFEFDNIHTTNFELFTEKNSFTDDTVCTIAFMDWMTNCKRKTDNTAREYLQEWCVSYLDAGYGGRFYEWICTTNPQPYLSYGNGAGMRISPIGYGAKNRKELRGLSIKATEISHNHAYGIIGAEVIATCVYMAKHGSSKEEIKEFALTSYPRINDLDYEELRKTFQFNETCQGTIPESIYCFLISDSFEDCLRKTISIGGDCDTTAAMSCAIAEAYYGIPEELALKVRQYLPNEMLKVIDDFYKKFDK